VTDEQALRDDLARVQVALAEQAAVATPLSELDLTARDISRITPVLRQVLDAVCDLLSTDMAAVWVSDPATGELFAAVWTGLSDEYVGGIRVPLGTGSAGRAVSERRRVLIADIASDETYSPFRAGALDHGVQAALSLPMLSAGGEPMGALTAYYREPASLPERDLHLVETLARQAGEMVERARLHSEARQLAALERRRGEQLRALADAAMAFTTAETLDELLRLVTEFARSVIGCHQGVATRLPHGWADATTYVALSEKYAAWRDYDVVPKGLGVLEYVTRENRPLRLTPEQLVAHPDWRGLRDAPNHPPLPDYLAAPFVGRDGRNLGLVQLSHKLDDSPFTAEDEAIVVQLAQMASSAVERLEALEGERAARLEAEEAARFRGLLSEASGAFSASLEPAAVSEQLVRILVPELAEVAVLHLLDARGEPQLQAVAAGDPAEEAAVRAWLETEGALNRTSRYGVHAVVRSGQTEVLPEIPDELLHEIAGTPERAQRLRLVLRGSGLVVPLIASGRTLGALSISRTERYGERELETALDIARRAALGLDNAARFAFERELAATLQRSLLPRELPASPLLTSASRYLAGARGTSIGGDWYDLLEVDDGMVLVVGDVMGRGVSAAAVMGQLRAAVRAFALEGHPPGRVLQLLDRVVHAMGDLHFTTCLVGRLDPAAGTLCLASAGHLSPVLVAADGSASLVALDPGLPLGVGGLEPVESEVRLGPGSAVLLYTDGLVEEVGEDVDEGLERLVRAASGPLESADELCERVLQRMGRADGTDDDTALLALLLVDPAAAGGPVVELELPAAPASAGEAREAVTRLLLDIGHGRLVDTAALLVTELVANTARHVGGSIRVRAGVRAGRLLVEVSDELETVPDVRPGGDWTRESGRGMQLVEALADRWGADPLPGGKRVWFELAV